VKFVRLGKTTSGQPIFAVDEEVAREIKATFVLDVALVRSFGRDGLGISSGQKAFVVGLALWKIGRLLGGPFRYRSGCDLACSAVEIDGAEATLDDLLVDIAPLIKAAEFTEPSITDVYWPADELYREGADAAAREVDDDAAEQGG